MNSNISKPHPPSERDNSQRQTAAIDRAWKRQDAQELEQALRKYAREDEQIICLTVENSRSSPTEFYLEPWAENVTLQPRAKVRVFVCEPKQFGTEYSLDNRTHLDVADEHIVLFAPIGSLAYVLEVIEQTPPS